MFAKKRSTFIDMEKIVILGLMVLFSVPFANSSNKTYKIVCYLSSWANYRNGEGTFAIEDIDPALCTHLVYAFATLTDNKITAKDSHLDLTENFGLGSYKRFNNLRESHPGLKTLIAIGGWAEGSIKYSQMALTPASRKTFVDSCVAFLLMHKFDGLDLQWLYPAQRGGRAEDKANFALLVKELQEAFRTHGFLLTALLSPQQYIIDSGYDVPTLGEHLDFISLLTYDFHGGWDKITGHNAPLNYTARDLKANRKLNVDFGVKYWLSKGAPSEKLILGMPLFGRSFRLQDPKNHNLGAPAAGAGMSGEGMVDGMMGYNEICDLLQSSGEWKIVFDRQIQAPYAVKDNQWIGYDNPKSIARKVKYLKKMKLGGGMVWSLDTDDFHGNCDEKAYSLLRAVNDTLNSENDELCDPTEVTVTPNGEWILLDPGKNESTDIRRQLKCAPGYQISGDPEEVCLENGIWSETDAACVEILCDPVAFNSTFIPNGPWILWDPVQKTSIGKSIPLKCSTGYQISGGSDKVACLENGTWAETNATCTEILCDPAALNSAFTANGQWTLLNPDGNSPVGWKGELKCNTGYRIIGGPDRVDCLETGKWAETNATCIDEKSMTATNEKSMTATNEKSMTATIIGVVGALILIILLILPGIIIYKKRKQRSSEVVAAHNVREGSAAFESEEEYATIDYDAWDPEYHTVNDEAMELDYSAINYDELTPDKINQMFGTS